MSVHFGQTFISWLFQKYWLAWSWTFCCWTVKNLWVPYVLYCIALACLWNVLPGTRKSNPRVWLSADHLVWVSFSSVQLRWYRVHWEKHIIVRCTPSVRGFLDVTLICGCNGVKAHSLVCAADAASWASESVPQLAQGVFCFACPPRHSLSSVHQKHGSPEPENTAGTLCGCGWLSGCGWAYSL